VSVDRLWHGHGNGPGSGKTLSFLLAGVYDLCILFSRLVFWGVVAFHTSVWMPPRGAIGMAPVVNVSVDLPLLLGNVRGVGNFCR
jgi:hypothetical protein